MSLEAQGIMQQLRNRVDTKSHGWAAFRAASVLGYIDAYHTQTGVLDVVKKNTELSNERCWMVFTMLFTIMSAGGSVVTASLGEWAGRLLEPAEKAPDLADELFHKTVDLMTDNAKDKIKGSLVEKQAESGGESRPWEPVVDDPETYDKKMELMLEKLAEEILGGLDDLVSKSASWSTLDATAFVSEFEASCPYITDLPQDTGKVFTKSVARSAELAMWTEWAAARDQAWWEEDDHDSDGNGLALFDPVLDRLTDLGVPLNDVTSTQRVGGTYYNQAARVLDMLKLIDWAKRQKAHKAKIWTKAELERAHQLLAPHVRTQDQLQCYRER